jgi:nucleoid-associated protein YgaU
MRVVKHTVREGDTLWALAEKHLGSGQRWRDLFLMNAPLLTFKHGESPEKVGPNFIFPGDELFLVEDVEFEPSAN